MTSREFSSSPRLVRFLRYCVEQSEAGRTDGLKESVVGVNVFDRAPGYDPKLDPIVRVHARRLREKLESFYQSAGSPEIVIRVPKGGYVAHFEVVPVRDEKTKPLEFSVVESEPIATFKAQYAQRAMPTTIRIGTITIACALMALAVFAWRAMPQPERGGSGAQGVQPLASLPGSTNDPAWSPDGKTLAFTWDGGASHSPQVYLLKKVRLRQRG